MLKYLPNNHLSNKINVLIGQVEHGEMVMKIYKKSKTNARFFDPKMIVAILKKCPGILSIMNYIVNIIKLNISAERKKRFEDRERTIESYERIIKTRNS
jgi:hypothetical protein